MVGGAVGRGAVLRVQSSLEWLVCVRAAGLTATVPVSRLEGSACRVLHGLSQLAVC